MRFWTLIVVLSVCLVACHAVCAIGTPEGEETASVGFEEAVYFLETWVESILDFDRLPGISLAVVHDQEIVYANGFGYANVERGVRATLDTHYSICSISKLFTSIAVMQLRDAGKLKLDDPVSKHLPWFMPDMVDPLAPAPTLKDLLRHSSGLPCEPDLTIRGETDLRNLSREELIRRASNVKASYPTNTEFNYSNLGYSLLGEVVSVISGMEYADYVRKNILEPLGLQATTPHLPRHLLGDCMAIGYGRWPRKGSRVAITLPDARAMAPAGGFASTVRDLAEFAMWQFRVLDGKDSGVLREETLREMQAVHWQDPAWGYGFTVWNLDGKGFVGHQGGCPGYKSQIILCPEEKIAVVVMINATDAPQFTLVFETYRIMASALGAPRNEDVEEEAHDWAKYTGYYTADLSWSAAEVLEWGGALSVLWVPTGNPLGSLVRLKPIEGEVFRQVKSDGTLGKHYVFGTDAAGRIANMKFNNNLLWKTAP
jgi:CubicO group peptidase (beta-lactamase class C family)